MNLIVFGAFIAGGIILTLTLWRQSELRERDRDCAERFGNVLCDLREAIFRERIGPVETVSRIEDALRESGWQFPLVVDALGRVVREGWPPPGDDGEPSTRR